MAEPWVLEDLQAQMSYEFRDLELLKKSLIAGDSNRPDDQEGHRGMAQLGDSLMGTVILSDGLERGQSRKALNDACSEIRSKQFCARIAKVLHLHEYVTTSERQIHIGIQPTTLKNAVAALIGAVWLDSHDYRAILQVMISIGLLNHAQYYELQDTLLMDIDISASFDDVGISCVEPGPSEIDGDYYSLLPEGEKDLEHLFQMQPVSGNSPSLASTSSAATISPDGTLDLTPPSSPDSFRRVERYGEAHQATERALDTASNASAQAQQPRYQDKLAKKSIAGDGRVTKRSARTGTMKGSGRHRNGSPACIIDTYIHREEEKEMTTQEHIRTIDIMKSYQTAILQSPTESRLSLAVLATSIGDSSALLVLKEALHGLRSSLSSDHLCIDRQMSIAERTRIIEQLGVTSAFLRLVRLLHIVTLWEALSQSGTRDGSNDFVIVTPGRVTKKSSQMGNPLHLERAAIGQAMLDTQVLQDGSSQNERKSNRLRRLGQRLGLIARQWGPAALLILGQGLSESKIMASTDGAFKAFITLIDKSEGARISAVSAAALPTLEHFRRGSQVATRLRLESLDEDAILRVPRLSVSFEDLLKPLDES